MGSNKIVMEVLSVSGKIYVSLKSVIEILRDLEVSEYNINRVLEASV